MKKKRLIFIIQGYQEDVGNMQMSHVCELELFCSSEAQAIRRAKKLIKKNHYRVSKIIEKEE